ncbi:hypothetical protein DPMN_000959 [Dreissena polymorpha]|uniref:Uncharacterized protein n=1 Tax=Dreissena polymorpha TaxID=45954 RepID=A0A9D4MIF5_DREPO|nr:hypothetical protein DPMN_000959 [Dreissena polymorpha]
MKKNKLCNPLKKDVIQRRCTCICDILRKPPSNTTMQNLIWNIQGNIKNGLPRNI